MGHNDTTTMDGAPFDIFYLSIYERGTAASLHFLTYGGRPYLWITPRGVGISVP